MARKRSKAPWGRFRGLLALLLLAAIALVVFSYLPGEAVPEPARPAHRRVVEARSHIDGTAVGDALPPQAVEFFEAIVTSC